MTLIKMGVSLVAYDLGGFGPEVSRVLLLQIVTNSQDSHHDLFRD